MISATPQSRTGVIAECFGLSGLRGHPHRRLGAFHRQQPDSDSPTISAFSRSSPYPSGHRQDVSRRRSSRQRRRPGGGGLADQVAPDVPQKFQVHVVTVDQVSAIGRSGHNEGRRADVHPAMDVQGDQLASDHARTRRKRWSARTSSRGRKSRDEAMAVPARREQEGARATRPTNGPIGSTARWVRMKGAGSADDPRPGNTRRGSRRCGHGPRKLRRCGRLPVHSHHPSRFLDAAEKAIETRPRRSMVDRRSAAFGSLLLEGHRVRLSGQDSERDTSRSALRLMIDQEERGERHTSSITCGEEGRFEGHQLEADGRGSLEPSNRLPLASRTR